jgi:hypothetical protein
LRELGGSGSLKESREMNERVNENEDGEERRK